MLSILLFSGTAETSDYGVVNNVITFPNSINESSFRVCSNITSLLDDDDFEGLEILTVIISSTSIANFNLPLGFIIVTDFRILDSEGM